MKTYASPLLSLPRNLSAPHQSVHCSSAILAVMTLCLVLLQPLGWAGTFTSDFETVAGTPLGSVIIEEGVLKLTTAEVNQRGTFLIDDLDAGRRVGSFTARFKARIGGGTERPAQGFSFVLANDLSFENAFGEGGGATKGLVISFDTADNNAGFGAEGNEPGDAPGVILKLGGFRVAAKKFLNLKTDDRFVDVLIQLDPDGTLDVVYDGVKIYDNFAFAYTPIAGNFALGSATSDLTAALRANHWIDDLNITTVPVSGAFVSAAAPAPGGASPEAIVDIELQDLTSQTVAMTFDQTAVTPNVTTQGNITRVTYDPPGLLASGSQHSVRLTYEGNRVFVMEFRVMSYPTLPANAAVPRDTVNTSASGFKARIYQVVSPAPGTIAAAEKQLAGGSGANIADLTNANADGTFDRELINFEQDGIEAGNFMFSNGFQDDFIPGIPGTTPDGNFTTDNIAGEFVAYLDLAAGAHTFGVNSDDGFRVTAGADPRDITGLELGVFDAPRGSSDTLFTFAAEQAGIYCFRLVWFEGTGGANVEFFSVKADGTKVLINDRTTAGHVKAYRERVSSFSAPPYVAQANPAPGQKDVSLRPNIQIAITEEATVLDTASIRLSLNGNPLAISTSKTGKTTTVSAQPASNLAALTPQTMEISFADNAGNQITRNWSFITGKAKAGFVSSARGYWTFDNEDLRATLGQDLQYIDTSLADRFAFGTTGTGPFADIPHINGQPAKFIAIPRQDDDAFRKMGLRMTHGIAPNGGGQRVNQWTIIMDLYWGDGHGFGTVLRTHDLDQNIDGDMFWRGSDGSYGKGCCSLYDGINPANSHQRHTWARVVFAVDLAANPRVFAKYVNGVKHREDVTGDGNALDSRFSLPPEIFMFNDGDDNEQSTVYVSAIQIREGRLTDEEVAALAGPSATGIPLPAPVAGQWDFEHGDLRATHGQDLQYIDPSLSDRNAFGTTGTGQFADIPHINGKPAKFIVIPRQDDDSFRKMGLRMRHGIIPNGGGQRVNQWTLIMDLYWGDGHGFGTVMRTHDLDQNIDGDMFWRGSDGAYGKGCCSLYDGINPANSHQRHSWARVVFAVDLAANPRAFAKYVNGVKHREDVTGDGNALDSRFSLPPEIFMFNDGDDNEQSTVYVSSIQIREGRLSDEEVAALGGPSAEGIPVPRTSPISGQWDFDGGTLAATLGQDLEYIEPSLADRFSFGTTGSGNLADIPHIDGQPAKVIVIPRQDDDSFRRMGLKMRHGLLPNGGGQLVNQWSLIMDLYWGDGHGFGTVLRTHDLNQNIDGDMFWRGSDGAYGKGCCSLYDGIDPAHSHQRHTWARVVFSVDLAANPRVFAKYINGVKHRQDVTGDGNALDSRFALPAEVFLFNDGDDNEQSTVYVNSIQMREGRLTDEEVAALGGPSANGIPAAIGPPPPPTVRLTVTRNGNNITLSWNGGLGIRLQQTSNLTTRNWQDVPGTEAASSVTLPVSGATAFFRAFRP